jgi:protein-S-isoprenylcysteine O-methyltransferase Ste14
MRIPDLGRRGQGWVVLQFVLIGLIALAGALPSSTTGTMGTILSVVGAALIVAGGVMAMLAIQALGPSFTPDPRPLERAVLVESGIYAVVRHPMYAGVTLGALGWGCLNGSPLAIALSGLLLVVLTLKSIREEAWLAERYPGYPAYVERTKRFFPGLI